MATRAQIREKIRAVCEPAGFQKTFAYSPSQVFEDEIPALSVYFEDGETEYSFDNEGVTDGRVIVEIMLQEPGDLDAALDAKANQVQQYLREKPFLDGLIEGMNRTNFAYDRDGEASTGVLLLTYTIQYLDED
ncbi:minor tail protein U [Alteromonas sp. 76-1]|jgi:hypothetical protein|uniref:phage tail terminator protein n=1 Tax=Alteromonas sp. 76-1 TaxID=2358187 RepID=UPI000FD163E0|nr:phage tail terminator protein [Alteromonas sp. 76-1]VEL96996.1 minor tail protein U [Alteromonas sp. 76-1]